ncbi:MAG: hypothetical protein ACK2TV_03365 [Anaerolineales bacterium]
MRKFLSVAIAVMIGIVVLAGTFFRQQMGPVLTLIVDWGILLVSVLGLLGIGYLIKSHITKLINKEKGAFNSAVVLLAFIGVLATGLILSTENEIFQNLILTVQVPVEASLLGMLAVILMITSLRLLKTRGWTLMSVGFLVSAVASLLVDVGFFQTEPGSPAEAILKFWNKLPLIGARGILLGMALGGVLVALRVLLTIDRPYGED